MVLSPDGDHNLFTFQLKSGTLSIRMGLTSEAKLHVIAVIFNPMRFARRYKLYWDFKKHVEEQKEVVLWTVEAAFGDRPFVVTEEGNPQHIQLRTWDMLWIKERMQNLALARLPLDAEYVATIDADVEFSRKDWAIETIHQLQVHHVVQMFSHAIDLGPNLETLKVHNGFGWTYVENGYRPLYKAGYGPYGFAHPGFAWAYRKEAIDHVGGFIDWAILGSADHHQSMGMIGQIRSTVPHAISDRYLRKLLIWQKRAELYIRRDLGYVNGTLLNHWDGKKVTKKYCERWNIITRNHFDPDEDLKADMHGLYQITENNRRLRDDIREYFAGRREDSVDVD